MDPRWKSFLDLIARSEATSTHPLTKNNGYDVIVTGDDKAFRLPPNDRAKEIGLEIFTIYSFHPFATGRRAKVIRPAPDLLTSTAAGRYQLELKWWRAYSLMLNLKDFSPASQDAVAIRQIKERAALPLIEAGNIEKAIEACSNLWASFPGNSYNQPQQQMAQLLDWYGELLNVNQQIAT